MAMVGLEEGESTAENYRRFARIEASGRSATYEALALAVADDEELLAFLHRLPIGKRQPNLLFAAARHVLGEVPDADAQADRKAAVIRVHAVHEDAPWAASTRRAVETELRSLAGFLDLDLVGE